VKVSVIIPVYNSALYIKKCINSVLNQTLKEIEIIIVNDGSTDNSLQIINDLVRNKSNVIVFSTENKGVAHARNIGLDIAQGEYIKFLDSDDSLSNEMVLEEMYNSAINNEAQTVIGLYYAYAFFKRLKLDDSFNCSGYHNAQIIKPLENKNFVFSEMPNVGNKLFSRELIGNLRFPEQLNWEDLAVVPALMVGSQNIYFTNEIVCDYRIHFNTSVKNTLFAQNIFEVFPIFKSLVKNMKAYGLYEYFEKELQGMYALHTSMKSCGAMSWINMSAREKREIINLFMNYVELTLPDYKEEEILLNYFETHPFFSYQFDRVQKMQEKFLKYEKLEELEKVVNKTLSKSKVLKK